MTDVQLHFVLSAPRSGSTWLATALNHHPQIFATEQRLFGEFFEVWPNPRGGTAPRITLDAYAAAFAGHYFRDALGLDFRQMREDFLTFMVQQLIHYAHQKSGKPIIVDKVTPYTGTGDRVVAQIRRYLPRSKIILLVRDGRDVATSGVFDWLHKDGPGTERYRFFVERVSGLVLTRLFDDASLAHWANSWVETIRIFDGRRLDGRIRYEAMKRDHAGELTQLFQLVGAAADPEVGKQCADHSTFDTMAGRPAGDERPLAKARKGVVGDWRNYFTRRDGQLFHQIAGDCLIAEGYESSAEWIDTLPESLQLVQPEST